MLKPLSAKAADFSGETIEWWIPFREGGGSDTWARALAPALGRFLPGEPPVIVVNNAQSGAIGGTNEFFSRMEPTGRMRSEGRSCGTEWVSKWKAKGVAYH